MWDAPQDRRPRAAMAVAGLAPLLIAGALVPLRDSMAHTDAALVLVVGLVLVAAWGDRVAGAVGAVIAALSFDFFLTPPYYRLEMTRRADVQTAVLLLAIGVLVTEIGVRARRQHQISARREAYADGIRAAAEAVASRAPVDALRQQVAIQLTRLLSLQACRFECGVVGLGEPARLEHDGRISVRTEGQRHELQGLPSDRETELLVTNGGHVHGRFLMTPVQGTAVDVEQRVVAVVLADQLGAALAVSESRSA